jgi:hypothetical protein
VIAAAIIGVMCGLVLRSAPSVWWNAASRASDQARAYAPDRPAREMLTAWAREQMTDLGPDRWARAVFETDTHEHMHLTADTGLPTFHNSWLPGLLLRERIEDLTPESLRRFNVRWVIAQDKDPTLGNPLTQFSLGSYRIREVAGWDGKFARIERGTGEVKTLRLDDRAVEIEVTGTTEPVLVALGTGYYPRWRATHASGAPEPVFAMVSHPGATLHVVAAWVAPGKTTFTCDGPLPSDHKGRFLSILAGLIAAAAIIVWHRKKLRIRVLRRLARLRASAPRFVDISLRYGVPVLCMGLLARGCLESRGVTRSLELGSGLRATATVEARYESGEWQTCSYSRLDGGFSCDGMLEAHDAMTSQLNDAMPSWGFNTPGIVATADSGGVEIRIKLRAKLDGTYWAATNESASVSIEGMEPFNLLRKIIVIGDEGEREVTITATLPVTEQWAFTFVHEDTILPDRSYLEPPPVAAPPQVRAIH